MPGRLLALVAAVVVVTTSSPTYALPAFARRFDLACGACHSAVPRLNAFGEAFHENGFKPPGTMWTPLPATLHDAITQGMAVWTRGEFFERSEYARGPDPGWASGSRRTRASTSPVRSRRARASSWR